MLLSSLRIKQEKQFQKMLYSHIMHSERLYTLNNVELKNIVTEYAPIYQRLRHWLDGPIELSMIISFSIALSCQIAHKPELQMILEESE
jgi:hypothetical protein